MGQRTRIGVALAALCFAGVADATAFGTRQGQPKSDFTILKEIAPNFFSVKVPQPNPEFELYDARITPQDGLCGVNGLGRDYDNDASGLNVQAAYRRMRDALTALYGHPKEYDFLHPGSIWNGPTEWVMAIKQNQRSLTAFWNAADGGHLPAGIHGIMLDVRATSANSAYLALSYEFNNIDACKARGVSDGL